MYKIILIKGPCRDLEVFKLGCGSSTNTRAELLALWASLRVAKDIGLPYLHIFGDSSVIINWAKGVSTLYMVNLEAWCENSKLLMTSFTRVDISHVYREHNTRADTLSKEGLCLAPGHLLLTESYDDEFIGEDFIQLFKNLLILLQLLITWYFFELFLSMLSSSYRNFESHVPTLDKVLGSCYVLYGHFSD